MELTIEKQEQKPLVERIEAIIKVKDFQATPSNAAIQEEAAKLFAKPKELVVVKRIHQRFGKTEATALVYLYDNEAALKKFEPKPKKKEKVKEETK